MTYYCITRPLEEDEVRVAYATNELPFVVSGVGTGLSPFAGSFTYTMGLTYSKSKKRFHLGAEATQGYLRESWITWHLTEKLGRPVIWAIDQEHQLPGSPPRFVAYINLYQVTILCSSE